MRLVIASVLFLLMSLSLQADDQPHISINAEGKVKTKPDMANFSVSIDVTELDAKSANAILVRKVKALVKVVRDYEIQDGSLDTSQSFIQAEYDYQLKPKKLLGYRATRQIQFNLISLKHLDELVSDIAGLEHATLNNIQFSLRDAQYFEDQALINAIQIAKQKAELIANELDINLGAIIKVNHQVNNRQPPMYARAMSLEMDSTKSSSYEQKEIEMNAFIEVFFGIK